MTTQQELNQMLREVIKEAQELKIPVPSNIYPEIIVNKRAKKRFGCCKRENNSQRIEVSSFILNCDPDVIRNVIAHEILHTPDGCSNHGVKWKTYAQMMNQTYGYNIKRVSSFEEMGLEENGNKQRNIKYIMKCRSCGKEFPRQRYTCVMKKISAYRCQCGGRLDVYQVKRG